MTALHVLHYAGAVSNPYDGVAQTDGWRVDMQPRKQQNTKDTIMTLSTCKPSATGGELHELDPLTLLPSHGVLYDCLKRMDALQDG
jgi:hypothetical protein